MEAHTVCADALSAATKRLLRIAHATRGGLRDSKDAACSSRQSVMALFRLIDRRHAGHCWLCALLSRRRRCCRTEESVA